MGKWEHKIEKYLSDEIEKIGGTCRKWVSPGHRGVPDQIVMFKGFTCYVETKTFHGPLKSWQAREQERLRKAGNLVYNLKIEHEIDMFVDNLKRNESLIERTMDQLKGELC